jgi:hypothetical protein
LVCEGMVLVAPLGFKESLSPQEILPRQTGFLDAEPPDDGRAQVREASPDAEIAGSPPADYEERDALSRVVSPGVGRCRGPR